MATNRHDEQWLETDFVDDDDARERWLDQWTSPCPDSYPQRVAVCLGYRERDPGRLQLRVALGGCDNGVCDAIVEENEDTVRVRLLVCYDEDRFDESKDREYMNCPIHVYLNEPLAGRTVIDVETDEPVPLFVPSWGDARPSS
jgi:hypothetical protein